DALQGEMILELSKATERFQARFDLKDGSCAMWKLGEKEVKEKDADGVEKAVIKKVETEIGRAEKVITKAGTYALRFANVDDRLTLWVDGKLPFQDKSDKEKAGVDYSPAPIKEADVEHPNNYEPASIGVRDGAKVAISHLQLWRDTYYTPYT